jgi:hypothetical protein
MIAPTAGGRKRAMATVCVSLTPENPATQSHWIESDHDLISLFEHDLSGKSVPTFPDQAVTGTLAES